MPNPLNYPEKLVSTVNQRPSRFANKDVGLMRNAEKEILFGTSDRDVVELWIYNPDGTLANHINVGPTETALTTTTIVDQSGTHEVLNINFTEVQRTTGIDPGRYVLVGNFFRNEVGSEDGYKLYISEISEDRTELRLGLVQHDPSAIQDLYEFLTPSVPRKYAAALMAEILGQSINAPDIDKITPASVETDLGGDIYNRLVYAGQLSVLENLLDNILRRTYTKALDLLAADITNQYVQKIEIDQYMSTALAATLQEFVGTGLIDPHFVLSN